MNKKLWNDEISNSFKAYIIEQNRDKKNRIYNKLLYPIIDIYIDIVIRKTGLINNDENRQELFIKSIEIIDKISIDNLITAHQYIYVALYNTAITLHRIPIKIPKLSFGNCADQSIEDVYEIETNEQTLINRKKI